jgi:FecR-like protein
MVEVNERTELLVRQAWSGATVQLEGGDVIVTAAKQRRGHLRVQTRDSVAAVKGTVFAVSAGLGGSLISVVEGAVAVTQPGVDAVLKPGQQAASNPALAHSVRDAVSWSGDAESYIVLLASFAKLEGEIARLASPSLRTESRLLGYLPDDMFLYGAIPNVGGTIDQAKALADLEAVQNPVFRDWWNSGHGQELRKIIDGFQTVAPLLGDEVVFAFGKTGPRGEIPVVFAEVRPGKRDDLVRAMDALRVGSDSSPQPYSVDDSLLVATDSSAHLQWIAEHLGKGATSEFGKAIAERYRRGAGWLAALDIDGALEAISAPKETEIVGAGQMKHLFFEQRSVQGVDENDVTLSFAGPPLGIASVLAASGSGGAAEYLSSDTVLAVYAATREPRQLFDELIAQLGRLDPSKLVHLEEAERRLGISLSADLAGALGTETAIALQGFSVTGPVWVMAALVNDSSKLDSSILRVVEVFNSELGPEDQAKRIATLRERVDGRDWIRLESGGSSIGVTWTYDRGYLVAGSDRGAVSRAIAVRGGGSALVWSAPFRQQLPSSGGVHPSAFAWLNTKGALQGLDALASTPALKKLTAERDPILVVLNGSTEQIHAASRTRWTGLVVDAMMLGSVWKNSDPMVPKRAFEVRKATAGRR